MEEFIPTYENTCCKSIVVFGGTGTGKSTLIEHLLRVLSKKIGQLIVFCPTDITHHEYSRIIPSPCIYDEIDATVLEEIINRQASLCTAYNNANQPDVLKSLFTRIGSARANSTVAKIRRVTEKNIAKIEEDDSDDPNTQARNAATITNLQADADDNIAKLQKYYITRNTEQLENMDLSESEMHSLRFHSIAPDIAVVIDDCTEQLMAMKRHKVIKQIAFKGRHCRLTMITVSHSPVALLPEIKNNSPLVIFTDAKIARAFFSDNKIHDRSTRDAAAAAVDRVFTSTADKSRKLVYMRDGNKFMLYRVPLREPGFTFGFAIIREYCEKVATNGSISSPYDAHFK